MKVTDVYRVMPMRSGRLVRFWASGGANFPKMGHSLPMAPINHRAKFDAASFILAGEIRNRTNKQKHAKNKQTLPVCCIVQHTL